jgi:hypothetical protein
MIDKSRDTTFLVNKEYPLQDVIAYALEDSHIHCLQCGQSPKNEVDLDWIRGTGYCINCDDSNDIKEAVIL